MTSKFLGHTAADLFSTSSIQSLLDQGNRILVASAQKQGMRLLNGTTLLTTQGLDVHYGTEWSLSLMEEGTLKIALRLAVRVAQGAHFSVQLYLVVWSPSRDAFAGLPSHDSSHLVHRLASVNALPAGVAPSATALTAKWVRVLKETLCAQDLEAIPPDDVAQRWAGACDYFIDEIANMVEP